MAELVTKYQQYEEYKDSGVEWLGEIPKGWKTGSLRWMIDIASGESLPSNCEKEFSKENQFPVVGGNGVMGFSNKVNTVNAAIAVGRVGALCGNIHSIDYDSWITDNALKISKWNKFSKDFLVYLLKTANLNDLASKTAQPLITGEQVKSLKVVFPSIDEQEKVANFLDHETAQIDTLIDKQQTLIELLKEKRQAVISHAVTSNKGEESAKLGYFIDILSGYSFPSAGYQAEAGGNTALLRGINVGVGALKWDETVWWSRTDRDGLDAFELEEGDIVFGMDRPWISAGARVAEVTKSDLPCLLLQRVIRIRANKNTYQPFIKLCLASKEFKFSVEADLTGVSVPHISPDQVKSFPIRDIGYEQQKTITDDAFEKMKVLDLIEDSAQQAIQLMQERRTALISAAVTGKIDVRDWVAPIKYSKNDVNNNNLSY